MSASYFIVKVGTAYYGGMNAKGQDWNAYGLRSAMAFSTIVAAKAVADRVGGRVYEALPPLEVGDVQLLDSVGHEFGEFKVRTAIWVDGRRVAVLMTRADGGRLLAFCGGYAHNPTVCRLIEANDGSEVGYESLPGALTDDVLAALAVQFASPAAGK